VASLREALGTRGDENARNYLDRAVARQNDARRALADGDPRRALGLTRVAHNLARNGLSELDDAGN
jgi:hypothetical protein